MEETETAALPHTSGPYAHLNIIIVGNPDSLFAYQLAQSWEELGAAVRILTVPDFYKGTHAPNGIEVLDTSNYVSGEKLKKWENNSRRLRKLEKFSHKYDGGKYRKAREEYIFESGLPSVQKPYLYGKQLAKALKTLKPDFVFVQESFTFGGLSLFYKKSPVVLFPFGGDIYTHSQVSMLAHFYMKRVLKKAALIMPTASSSVSYLKETFDVPVEKVQPVSWGVDRGFFKPMTVGQKELAKQKWNIPADRKVVLNIRRFRPGWGALVALETFIRLAEEYPGEYYFILLGGAGKDKKVLDEAAERLKKEKLTDRILLIEERISLDDVSDLMGMSDVFVNLMAKEDMRSFSIIQGAARGSVPVLIDQPEYRHMEKDGFKAVFIPENDPRIIAEAVHRLCSDADVMKTMASDNLEYIREYEDGAIQVKKMLDIISSHL